MEKIFFKKLSILFILLFCLFIFNCNNEKTVEFNKYFIKDWQGDGWGKVPEILNRLKAPS